MVSKIIQKEKKRQREYRDGEYSDPNLCELGHAQIKVHKQSLINLKEYMEEEHTKFILDISTNCQHCRETLIRIELISRQRYEDIEELNKMIGRYE